MLFTFKSLQYKETHKPYYALHRDHPYVSQLTKLKQIRESENRNEDQLQWKRGAKYYMYMLCVSSKNYRKQ